VTQPCYTGFVVPDPTATECGDPDQYLFWDAEHPTSRFNALFAEEIFASALQCEESDKGHGPVKCAINAHTH
jgi:phospholipase/lecithinase/hemolysin